METNVRGFLRDRARLLGWEFVACVIPGVLLLAAGVAPKPVLISMFLGSALVSWVIDPAMLVKITEPKSQFLEIEDSASFAFGMQSLIRGPVLPAAVDPRVVLALLEGRARFERSTRRIKRIWLPTLTAVLVAVVVVVSVQDHPSEPQKPPSAPEVNVVQEYSASRENPAQREPSPPVAKSVPSPTLSPTLSARRSLGAPKLVIHAAPGVPTDALYRSLRHASKMRRAELADWMIHVYVEPPRLVPGGCELWAYARARREASSFDVGPFAGFGNNCESATESLGMNAVESFIHELRPPSDR